MNTLRIGLFSFVVGALAWWPMGGSAARADDDWEDRWEDYYEDLEEQREEAREAAEERWEDEREWAEERWEEEQERIEELREEGYVVRRNGRWHRVPRYYYDVPGPIVRHGGSAMRHRRYYREPVYGPYYPAGPPVVRYYRDYPRWYRFYGVPGFGYAEYPYGQREVQAGPVRVYWWR